MDTDGLLFKEKDPRGYDIVLTKYQYVEHILIESEHTDISPEDIRRCVCSPDAVYQSSRRENRDVYFSKSSHQHSNLYVKAVVEIDDAAKKEGHVVTTFVQPHISGGIVESGGLKYVKSRL